MAIRVSGLISGLDTDSIVQELVSAYSTKKEKYEKAQTKQEWKMDAWKTMNSKIYGFYTSSLSNMRMSTAYSLKTSSVSNSNIATVKASSSAVNGTQKMKVNKLASSAYMTGGVVKLSDDKNDTGNKKVTGSTALSDMGIETGSKIAVNDTEIEITDGMTVNQLISKFKDAGINASFDETNQRFFVNAKTSGAEGEFTLMANNEEGFDALQKLGLFAAYTTEKDTDGKQTVETAEMTKYRKLLASGTDEQKKLAKKIIEEVENGKVSSDAARISGQDAEIVLNGATFTSSTGTFSINGLSITAMQVTAAGEEVSITTSNDTQGMYNKIKEFLGKYNELIKDMDTAYNAAAAKDYEPLTDDEKKDMSDNEIEKWETKIKDSLLRRDSTLGNTSSALKSLMNTSFEINGKTYSLSSFGINTASYFSADTNEKGCLHIDGDADDATTSGNEDKLMAAINEDPEVVAEFFQKLSTSVYNDLTKRMASSSVSSIYTIYNDKQMSSEYSDYKDKVSKWQEKLEYYEEFYYKKFSAMEKALSKLQSSTSSLSNLLGS
jgi:flagellar capping protein FliD